MKTPNTFVVKRSEWQRGKNYAVLAKPTATGTLRCCLGFYGNQICGLTDSQMTGLISPAATVKYGNSSAWGDLLFDAEEKDFSPYHDSGICSTIMGTNDAKDITDEEREETLTALFLELNKQIIFVD